MNRLNRRILLLCTVLPLVGCGNGNLAFDPVAWRDRAQVSQGVRVRMVDSLLSRHKFLQLDKEAVLALLGPPEQTNYFRDWDLVYWLGPERSFVGIDSEWLLIKLDRKGEVVDYRLATD